MKQEVPFGKFSRGTELGEKKAEGRDWGAEKRLPVGRAGFFLWKKYWILGTAGGGGGLKKLRRAGQVL